MRGWLGEMPAMELSRFLIGGIARAELPFVPMGLTGRTMEPHDFVLPPLPNQLFTRDSSCWIYGGVTINPMYWPARQPETVNLAAVYKFHPRFAEASFETWWGDADAVPGIATLEGGDVMPLANGVVLIGMGERTTPQAVFALAARLFAKGAAERIIAALLPRDRSFTHLDTIFTFCDRDLVTVYPPVVERIRLSRSVPATGQPGSKSPPRASRPAGAQPRSSARHPDRLRYNNLPCHDIRGFASVRLSSRSGGMSTIMPISPRGKRCPGGCSPIGTCSVSLMDSERKWGSSNWLTIRPAGSPPQLALPFPADLAALRWPSQISILHKESISLSMARPGVARARFSAPSLACGPGERAKSSFHRAAK